MTITNKIKLIFKGRCAYEVEFNDGTVSRCELAVHRADVPHAGDGGNWIDGNPEPRRLYANGAALYSERPAR